MTEHLEHDHRALNAKPDHPDHKISDRTKIRDGQVANRPVYAAIGVTLDGRKDILGLWAGTGGEGAKFWMSVLLDMKNRACGTCSSWSATG